MKLRALLSVGILVATSASAQVRVVVKDGRHLIYNDGARQHREERRVAGLARRARLGVRRSHRRRGARQRRRPEARQVGHAHRVRLQSGGDLAQGRARPDAAHARPSPRSTASATSTIPRQNIAGGTQQLVAPAVLLRRRPRQVARRVQRGRGARSTVRRRAAVRRDAALRPQGAGRVLRQVDARRRLRKAVRARPSAASPPRRAARCSGCATPAPIASR